MPSANETYQAIRQIHNAVSECLSRCRAKPAPSKERLDRILRTESALSALGIKASAAIEAIRAPARKQLFELNTKIQSVRAQINKLEQELRSLVQQEARADREFIASQPKVAGNQDALRQLAEERNNRKTKARKEQQEVQAQIESLNLALRELEAELPGLQSESDRQEQELLSRRDATLEEIEQESSSQLNEVGAFEREIEKDLRIGEELRQIAKADFESKSTDFETAELLHRSQALWMLWAILVMVVLSVVVIYLLFIRSQFPADLPPGSSLFMIVERMVFFGVGRIALLFFCAWAIKYLSELHRSHSEQSVIYRDRKAALGVAQSMLNASPELAQKQELLRTLATGYLDFDQNAFHAFRSRRGNPSEATDRDALKQLKTAVKAVQPLIDSLKGIVDKAK